MDDIPSNDYHSLSQDRPGHYPSLGPPHYQEGYPLTQLSYPHQPASPSQNTLSRYVQPQVHSPQFLPPYTAHYMPSPFPAVPPMAYYYPYRPTPAVIPNSDILIQISLVKLIHGLAKYVLAYGVSSRPIPVPHESAVAGLATVPQVPLIFPVTPASESWHPGPVVGTEYKQYSSYPLQPPFSAHTMGLHTGGYVSAPPHIPHVPPLSDTSYPSSSLLPILLYPSIARIPPHIIRNCAAVSSTTSKTPTEIVDHTSRTPHPIVPSGSCGLGTFLPTVLTTNCYGFSNPFNFRLHRQLHCQPQVQTFVVERKITRRAVFSLFFLFLTPIVPSSTTTLKRIFSHAVATCNGRYLRPNNPRYLPLVCKVRNRDEDFRAGVGAQRGLGMHARWVQTYKAQAHESGADHGVQVGPASGGIRNSEGSSPPERRTPSISSGQSPSSGERPTSHSPATAKLHDSNSGSVSFASTNSSLLANHFPQRYFILKSLTYEDLNMSVERKLWATQPHNEAILDQAYRTSKDVFLIFGANRTGDFSAMQGNDREDYNQPRLFLSPEYRPLRKSPGQISPRDAKKQPEVASAPAVMNQQYRRSPVPSNRREVGTYEAKSPFHLDRAAPLRAMRRTPHPPQDNEASSSKTRNEADVDSVYGLNSLSLQEDPPAQPIQGLDDPSLHPTSPEGSLLPTLDDRAQTSGRVTTWGTPFSVEWIRVQPLPFHRTRHLRNPWNTDREVKVSRDGTELEPEIGRRLLREWDELPATPIGEPSRRSLGGRATFGRGPRR
ncbi:hypothetical protein BS47DRAFT_1486732 [Hydnum rufescens UP504]|uniref:YTH domain-containing protein n=1 Tax=Hydnum rufescens UP504 TaxID=1448309 RepID=A0A9P6ATM2_9AGAM|nr:hypothetical protein BS47DRAFT_1486732 [Hydnum rufescens UP504]